MKKQVKSNDQSRHILDLSQVHVVPAESATPAIKVAPSSRARKQAGGVFKETRSKGYFELPERLREEMGQRVVWHKPAKSRGRSSRLNFLSEGQGSFDEMRHAKSRVQGTTFKQRATGDYSSRGHSGLFSAFIRGVFVGRGRSETSFVHSESREYFTKALLTRQLVWFFVCAFVVIAPVQAYSLYQNASNGKDEVLEYSQSALAGLSVAKDALAVTDLAGAGASFLAARRDFIAARSVYDRMSRDLAGLIAVVPEARIADRFLVLGQAASEAGHYLTQGLEMIAVLKPDAFVRNSDSSDAGAALPVLGNSMKLALGKLAIVKENLGKIDENDVPEAYRETFLGIQSGFPEMFTTIESVSSMVDFFSEIFGYTLSRRYLVIFQNNAELRPTGGFIGSLAILDLDRGAVKKLEVPGGGPYDFEGSLTAGVASPEPLWLVEPRWQFHDANWWPDFPASAKKLMWFYEYADGSTVDGVISLTPDVVEGLLTLVGPVELPAYGITVDKHNFRRQTQEEVELKYNKTENRPKAFIADLTPILLERVLSGGPEMLLQVLALFERSLSERSMMLYFRDPSLEKKASDWGWSGEMLSARRDYLSVVEANIGGGKTDLVIKRNIEHSAEIKADGTVVNTVRFARSHQGDSKDIFEGIVNNAYIRFYVPAGSRLIEATGFGGPGEEHFKSPPVSFVKDSDLERIEGSVLRIDELGMRISQEFGKTVFGGWQVVHPGEEKEIVISYQLPWRVTGGKKDVIEQVLERFGALDRTASWSLFVQRQPGVMQEQVTSSVVYPPDWNIAWKSNGSEAVDGQPNALEWSFDLTRDKGVGVVFGM